MSYILGQQFLCLWEIFVFARIKSWAFYKKCYFEGVGALIGKDKKEPGIV